jgi:NAD(P)-dependent dehydrogenase (short-subunit alcohol dehydrogenase family)
MVTRNHGHIINIISSGALSGNAFTSSYSSSKAALLSMFTRRKQIGRVSSVMSLLTSIDFTETLSQELILAKATGVRATAVLPFYLDGGIYTTLRK